MMKNFKCLLPVLFFVFFFQEMHAQFVTLGSDPAYSRWRQIRSENYTLIYPRETDSIARRYLYLLEKWRPAVIEPMRITPKRIPVVLHPYSTLSNGMVTWAPKRMELYTTPDAYDGYPDVWDENLVIHESRHVAQCEHFTKGVWKVLHYIIGEQSTGLGIGLYSGVVDMEGDAVIAETELTRVGRGRRADFLQYQRAACLNDDFRSWDQLRFGSFRRYTPNHYVLGYLMQAALRMKSSNYYFPGYYWSTLVRYWYDPLEFGCVHENYTGHSRLEYVNIFQKTLSDYWKEDLLRRGDLTQGNVIRKKRTRNYSDYRHPIPYHDPLTGQLQIYGRQSGMDYTERMIRLDSTGKQHFVSAFSPVSSKFSLSSDGIIYWTETVKRRAAQLEDFSVLKCRDLKKGRTRILTRGTRYYNPAPSVTGDTIALAQYPVAGSSYLVFLDAHNGRKLSSIEAFRKGQIKELTFMGKEVYATIVLDKGIGIYRYSDGKWSEIVPQQYKTIKDLRSMGRYLYFTSDLDDLQNIYALDVNTRELFRLTNSEYGASDPQYDPVSGDFYYAQFSHEGYEIVRNRLGDLPWTSASFADPANNPWAERLSAQAHALSKLDLEALAADSDTLPETFDEKKYPSRRYSKFSHLFRFHSWAPVYYNIDKIMSMSFEQFHQAVSLGVTGYSQNTLGTAVTMLGYSYHSGYHAGHVKFTYSGLGPTIELSADVNERGTETYRLFPIYSHDPSATRVGGHDDLHVQDLFDHRVDPHTVHFNTNVRIYYPLNLYGGGWQRGFIPQFAWNFNNDRFYSYQKKKDIHLHQLTYALRYYQMLPIQPSGLFPRYGFSLTAMGAAVPYAGENFGQMYHLSTYFYLPGFVRNQGMRFAVEWQQQLCEGKNYYVGSYSSFPRGYKAMKPTQKYFKVTFDYAIPIHLGDVSLGPVFYLKRLQLIPFGDFAMDFNPRASWKSHYSFGADVLLDFFFLEFTIPFSIGVRYARTGAQGPFSRNQFEFLFNISL